MSVERPRHNCVSACKNTLTLCKDKNPFMLDIAVKFTAVREKNEMNINGTLVRVGVSKCKDDIADDSISETLDKLHHEEKTYREALVAKKDPDAIELKRSRMQDALEEYTDALCAWVQK
ncbi:hypothetical protein M430DRAFT_27780 [Amorphotheca resinae ATCC 22711]|uniref:Uncharacterized protein n=1 Tax=Amorphotheca resinae ATCC 22711 TaxID=857342 RepID=A0A2T3B171_AMORE|nr:hypothetical protein M430DRAFT_27780 [Amorphotheca resinae ATCC 22711]PSS18310.1 hypothetical protein M430DRAFT_27780 [Amorphotheca resinae ATCC 22711]